MVTAEEVQETLGATGYNVELDENDYKDLNTVGDLIKYIEDRI